MADAAAAGAQVDPKAQGEAGKAGAAAAAAAGDGKAAAAAGEPKPGEQAAGGDGKAGGAEGDKGGKAGAAAAAPKAPEKYDLKLPDGGDQYIGDEDLKYLEQVARESDWTQEEAQAEIEAAVERATKREQATATKYLAELKADADYGGDKLEETQRLSKKAIDRIFPAGHKLRDRFMKTMNRAVYGNNLVLAAALAEVGRLMGEDSPAHARGGGAGAGGKDAATTLYDNPTSPKA